MTSNTSTSAKESHRIERASIDRLFSYSLHPYSTATVTQAYTSYQHSRNRGHSNCTALALLTRDAETPSISFDLSQTLIPSAACVSSGPLTAALPLLHRALLQRTHERLHIRHRLDTDPIHRRSLVDEALESNECLLHPQRQRRSGQSKVLSRHGNPHQREMQSRGERGGEPRKLTIITSPVTAFLTNSLLTPSFSLTIVGPTPSSTDPVRSKRKTFEFT